MQNLDLKGLVSVKYTILFINIFLTQNHSNYTLEAHYTTSSLKLGQNHYFKNLLKVDDFATFI